MTLKIKKTIIHTLKKLKRWFFTTLTHKLGLKNPLNISTDLKIIADNNLSRT